MKGDLMMRKKVCLMMFLLIFCICGLSHASSITGNPVGNGFSWVPPSTNALNYDQATTGTGFSPGYVLFNANDFNSITLDFFGPSAGISFFEYRVDGVATGSTNHPVVTGDTIHLGVSTSTGTIVQETFNATQYVDVRLALGGERDWDFDWVRFQTAPIPEPTTMLLFGFGLLGLAGVSRKKK